MIRTLILIAHRAGARVFVHNTAEKKLELLKEINYPEGRLQNREINSDKPGRSLSSFQGIHHSMSNEQEPREHVAQVFAKDLALQLEQALSNQHCEKLILVAEPKFLGLMRGVLPPSVKAKVVAELAKDLVHVSQHELPQHLNEVLRFE